MISKRTILINCIGGLIAPLVQFWFVPNAAWTDLRDTALFSLIYSNAIGTLASVTFTFTQPRLNRTGTVRTWSLVVLILVLCNLIGCAIASAAVVGFGLYSMSWARLYVYSFRVCLPITLAIGVVVGAVDNARERLRISALQLRTGELERERAEKLSTEARLSSLSSRVHPHFLFNVLNSISSLIREDPERAERLIEQMSSLLRYSLDSDQSGVVPLSKELKIVTDYLEIEKTRFGERLRYHIEVSDFASALAVPPMSVQTLVENSIKYAVTPRRDGGTVTVTAQNGLGMSSEGVLTIEVWDDGPGFSFDLVRKGHGLDLLEARLKVIFGPGAGLQVNAMGTGTTVRMQITPVKQV